MLRQWEANSLPGFLSLLETRLSKKEFLSEAPVIEPQNFHIEKTLYEGLWWLPITR